MQSSIIIFGAVALVAIIILLIVLAPSTRNRGYRDNREKGAYELERIVDEEQERAKGEKRYRY